MSTMYKLGLLFLVCTAAVLSSSAQSAAGSNRRDLRDAKRLAHRFYDDLLKTKDIRPLYSRYFAADHVKRCLLNKRANEHPYGSVSMTLLTATAKKVSRRDVERYQAAENNFFYFTSLIENTPDSTAGESDNSTEPRIPERIAKVVRGVPFFDAWLAASDEGLEKDARGDVDEAKYTASTVRRFYQILRGFERINPLLARYAIQIHAADKLPWKEMLERMPGDFAYFEPHRDPCADECYGFPIGKEIITINIPYLQLDMARMRGKMRVLRAIYLVD